MEVSNPDSQPTENAPPDTVNEEQKVGAPRALQNDAEEKSGKSLGSKEQGIGKGEVKATVQESHGGADPV